MLRANLLRPILACSALFILSVAVFVQRQRTAAPWESLREKTAEPYLTTTARTRAWHVQRDMVKYVDPLEHESLEESLARLTQFEEKMVAAGSISQEPTPRVATEQVLSSRRYLKVRAQLAQLPPQTARRHCLGAFAAAHRRQRETIERIIQHWLDPTQPPNEVSLQGNYVGVCAALLLSAEFAPEHTCRLLGEVRSFDRGLHRLVEQHPAQLTTPATEFFLYAMPDLRFCINALLVSLRQADSDDAARGFLRQALSDQDFEVAGFAVARWNAPVVPFDFSQAVLGDRIPAADVEATWHFVRSWGIRLRYDESARDVALDRLLGLACGAAADGAETPERALR